MAPHHARPTLRQAERTPLRRTNGGRTSKTRAEPVALVSCLQERKGRLSSLAPSFSYPRLGKKDARRCLCSLLEATPFFCLGGIINLRPGTSRAEDLLCPFSSPGGQTSRALSM